MSNESLKNQPQDYLVTDLSDPAEKAIKGMPPSPLADALTALESTRYVARSHDDAKEEIRLLRSEINTLVNAYVVSENQAVQRQIQAAYYQSYVKMNDELREHRKFLAERFQGYLDEAVDRNVGLLQVTKEIILDLLPRPEKPKPAGWLNRFLGLSS